MLSRLGEGLRLREGEGRLLTILGGFLFLITAATTLLEAGKNSLFLDVYPARLIPHSMIGAAFVAAGAAVTLTAVMGRFGRRSLATGLSLLLALSLGGCYLAFRTLPASAFGIYLWASAVQVLVLTHGWDYVGDLLTGRQAKRLVPLIAAGGSLAAVVAGFSVAPAALALGAEALLWLAGVLILLGTVLLYLVREPGGATDPEEDGTGGFRALARRSTRGFKALASHRLLRLLAMAVVVMILMSTLVDFQWKLAVQERFRRDEIAVAYGLLAAAVGVGALFLQVVASRFLFPRLGISVSAMLHAGVMTVVALGLALFGAFGILALLQFLDDALRESIEKPVEQVSLLPFPARIKTAAFTTLNGVLRPLSKAGGALIALALVSRPDALPWATAALAGVALVLLTRHSGRYRLALEQALSKHLVDFRSVGTEALVVDRTAMDIMAQGLEDEDPSVVVFSLSLLQNLDPEDTAALALPLLEHPVSEVRAEAARVLGGLAADPRRTVRPKLVERLDVEESPGVLGRVLAALGTLGHEDPTYHLERFLDHPEPEVRQASLTTLARRAPERVEGLLDTLLHSDDPEDRAVALRVVSSLGDQRYLPAATAAVADDAVRAVALEALSAFGASSLPALDSLLARSDIPHPVKRRLVTSLAGIDDATARSRLLQLVNHPQLGPAALTSLKRLRTAGEMAKAPLSTIRPLLRAEAVKAARYALLAGALSRNAEKSVGFVAREMEELRIRHTHRLLAVLALGYDADEIIKVESSLFSEDESRKSNALEFLEVVLEPEDAALTLPVAECDPGKPTRELYTLVADGQRIEDRPLEVLQAEDEWWPRALAAFALDRPVPAHDGSGTGIEGTPPEPEEAGMLPLIEKVMLLKGSELFRNFPGNELAGIADLATTVHFQGGELVFDQGDQGDAYYLVVRGGIRIIRDGHELAVLGSREGFGEMAILDQETRSATARAAESTTLLRIDRDSFDQLVEQNPAVARGIYRVLTQRLRNTLAQIAAGG